MTLAKLDAHRRVFFLGPGKAIHWLKQCKSAAVSLKGPAVGN